MLHDNVSVPEIVDSQCAHEFLMEATKLATAAEMEDTGHRLERKSRRFQELLSPEAVAELDEAGVTELLRMVFMLRRKAGALLKHNGIEPIRAEIQGLLYGKGEAGARLERFCSAIRGVGEPARVGLASELLHYTAPERYWLWTTWIWDPKTSGGALPLVLQKEADLNGAGMGETYELVGRATAMVNAAGHTEGFSKLGRGMFGTNLFLACVYTVYMHTVFRMKLSDEFNRILPALPEFTRRMLGVQGMETDARHV